MTTRRFSIASWRSVYPSAATSVAALAALAVASSAQAPLLPTDYSHNWAPMHALPTTAFDGPALFGLFTGTQTFATPTEGIRRVYGFDTTQGGRNQSTGQWESAWFKLAQGYASTNALPGVDVGKVIVGSASDSDPESDAGFAPTVSSVGNTGGWHLSADMTPGLISATAGFPYPWTWELAFQWTGGAVGPAGVTGPIAIGTDLGGGGPGNPLLANAILEMRGPATGGPLNDQYYLASINESVGLNPAGTGGVTNGNTDLGKSLFGDQAHKTNAVSHTRLFYQHPLFGAAIATNIFVNQAGDTEWALEMAFNTPFLWASKNGYEGSGSADWQASAAPVSIVDLRLVDHLSGAQTNANVDYKFGGSGPPAAAYDASILFNRPLFLWSASHAVGMWQEPTSWDDLGGALFPAQQGGLALGSIATSREGWQRVPLIFDGLTAAILSFPNVSFGTTFTGSEDPFLDGLVVDGTGKSHSSLFEGIFDPIISGVSCLSSGPIPVVSSPQPSLAGAKLGIAAIGIQIRSTGSGNVLELTEVSSSLEIDLQ